MGAEAASKAIAVPAKRPEVRVPSVLRSGLLVFAVKAALRIRGFGWAVRWIRQRVEAVPVRALVDGEAVRASEHAVALACALYPGRALCLERSLTLYYLLRRQGVDVRFVYGVKVDPFAAHAWVEYSGEPINDLAEHVSYYSPMSR